MLALLMFRVIPGINTTCHWQVILLKLFVTVSLILTLKFMGMVLL